MNTAALILAAALSVAGPMQKYASYGRVIDAATLDASSATFGVDISAPQSNGIWGLMTVWVCLTDANDSVTALNMSCTGSRDNGTTDHTLEDCTMASGVCTSNSASWTKSLAAITSPKCWVWRVDVEGLPNAECTFTHTGGAAADLLTVFATFATKG